MVAAVENSSSDASPEKEKRLDMKLSCKVEAAAMSERLPFQKEGEARRKANQGKNAKG